MTTIGDGDKDLPDDLPAGMTPIEWWLEKMNATGYSFDRTLPGGEKVTHDVILAAPEQRAYRISKKELEDAMGRLESAKQELFFQSPITVNGKLNLDKIRRLEEYKETIQAAEIALNNHTVDEVMLNHYYREKINKEKKELYQDGD